MPHVECGTFKYMNTTKLLIISFSVWHFQLSSSLEYFTGTNFIILIAFHTLIDHSFPPGTYWDFQWYFHCHNHLPWLILILFRHSYPVFSSPVEPSVAYKHGSPHGKSKFLSTNKYYKLGFNWGLESWLGGRNFSLPRHLHCGKLEFDLRLLKLGKSLVHKKREESKATSCVHSHCGQASAVWMQPQLLASAFPFSLLYY